jgi:hypothetical protein
LAVSYFTNSTAIGQGIATTEVQQVAIGPCSIELQEIAVVPAVPAANKGRIYLDDDGSGVTVLRIRTTSGIEQISPAKLRSYTVGTLPSVSAGAGALIHVTNETGGAVTAFCDGTNWRRVTDRAIVA